MAAQGQNALVQRINEKLALLNQRADQIRGISTANQEAVAQVVPRVTAIKDRIVALREAITRMSEAKRQLQQTLDGMEPGLNQLQATLQDGVNQIDLTALDQQLQALDTEIGNLEALVAGGDLPDAPGAPPGGVPPPDDGGDGDYNARALRIAGWGLRLHDRCLMIAC